MTLQHIRNLLDNSITNLKNELDLYTYNPEHSFSRNRKLPFEKVISTLLAMGAKVLIMNFFINLVVQLKPLLHLLLFNNAIKL